jgi:hypothetical protein
VWSRYGNDRLLDLRLKDLGLQIDGSWLETCVERLYDNLRKRGVRFRPHVWLSSEWFSPDGVPGIAIPFYLAHPRLAQLERRQMLEVEGGTVTSCMRLMRHEAGHAIDSAFRLHFKKRWRKTFGSYTKSYPETYRPKPNSRAFVVHLDAWYAQAHPAEDFAETFAVWLAPRSNWRQRYGDWPAALRKLRSLEALMQEHVLDRTAPVRSRATIDPVGRSNLTLREYYDRKRERYTADWGNVYDRDLRRLFSNDTGYRDRPTAASFLRRIRREIRDVVSEWTGVHTYTVDQVMQDIIERCRLLALRLTTSESDARTGAILLVTVHTMTTLHLARYEVPM